MLQKIQQEDSQRKKLMPSRLRKSGTYRKTKERIKHIVFFSKFSECIRC